MLLMWISQKQFDDPLHSLLYTPERQEALRNLLVSLKTSMVSFCGLGRVVQYNTPWMCYKELQRPGESSEPPEITWLGLPYWIRGQSCVIPTLISSRDTSSITVRFYCNCTSFIVIVASQFFFKSLIQSCLTLVVLVKLGSHPFSKGQTTGSSKSKETTAP